MRILDKQAQWIEYKKFHFTEDSLFSVNTRYSCLIKIYNDRLHKNPPIGNPTGNQG